MREKEITFHSDVPLLIRGAWKEAVGDPNAGVGGSMCQLSSGHVADLACCHLSLMCATYQLLLSSSSTPFVPSEPSAS